MRGKAGSHRMELDREHTNPARESVDASVQEPRADLALRLFIDDVVIPALLERLFVPTQAEGSPITSSQFFDPPRTV